MIIQQNITVSSYKCLGKCLDDVVEGWHIYNVRSVYKQVHSKDAASDLSGMLRMYQYWRL